MYLYYKQTTYFSFIPFIKNTVYWYPDKYALSTEMCLNNMAFRCFALFIARTVVSRVYSRNSAFINSLWEHFIHT